MDKIMEWSNSEMRALTKGEAHYHYSAGAHKYTKSDWYIWFFGNTTRYAIFQTFLWKYGEGKMVGYNDLTRTKKAGSRTLKIDNIKATVRDGISLGFIEAYKSERDKRVTLYSFNDSVLQEITDYCFKMRRNRMWEIAGFISDSSSDTVNNRLAEAGLRKEWFRAINNFLEKFAISVKAKFGEDKFPNVVSLKK